MADSCLPYLAYFSLPVTSLDLRSGTIHNELNLKNSMPSVCNAMTTLGNFKYEIIFDTPSGKSSTKVVRYFLE